jgi:magnesium chelatase family protein
MVVLACNPCPCGDYHPHAGKNGCDCSEVARREYRRKLTGPLIDRIDITRHLVPVSAHEVNDPLARPETSAMVRDRVAAARARQASRYAQESWRLNSQVPGPALRSHYPVAPAGQRLIDEQVYSGRLSRRGATRVHRVAWTIADLWEVDRPATAHVQAALELRLGLPLPVSALRRAG